MSGPLRRFVLTGAPGSGKTAILEALSDRGYPVVAEAATDVIAWRQASGVEQPWTDPSFVDAIAEVQRHRQLAAPDSVTMAQFHDRSPLCTLALARYLGYPVSPVLAAEVERVIGERVYDRRVFFVRPLGHVAPTAARRITFEEALAFERFHEEAYREYGFELIDVPAAPVAERVATIEAQLQSWSVTTSLAKIKDGRSRRAMRASRRHTRPPRRP